MELYEAIRTLGNSKVRAQWSKHLFLSANRDFAAKKGLEALSDAPILKSKDIREFNERFFKLMHLFKAKATLSDYFDLNRRYFKATDVVLFQDAQVKLDVLPMCYTELIGKELLTTAFVSSDRLGEDVALNEIHNCFAVDLETVYERLGHKLGKEVINNQTAKQVIKDERYERFNKLIDERFSTENIITLLTHFETRNDGEIRKMITDNADIPTMFEYIVAISWYIISDRKGDVLSYMNLSLEADLLPKTHAGGGEADIIWHYPVSYTYPAHTLLLEVTLADGSNQRRMEMEPVSRHLGEYLLEHPQDEAYCIFVSTFLNSNVISDFRGRRYMEYYDSKGNKYIDGMKIMPLQTTELKTFLKNGFKYAYLYKVLDAAYKAEGRPREWYKNTIAKETWLYSFE